VEPKILSDLKRIDAMRDEDIDYSDCPALDDSFFEQPLIHFNFRPVSYKPIIGHFLSLNPQHGCVATIGNFDGVHRGHQALLRQLQAIAQEKNLPAVIVLFEPQPQEFFCPDKAPARLTTWKEKVVNVGRFTNDSPPLKKGGRGDFAAASKPTQSLDSRLRGNDEIIPPCEKEDVGRFTDPSAAAEGSKPTQLLNCRNDELSILTLRFNEKLANLTAQEFIQQILIDKLNVKHLLIGKDFKFGKDRSGNLATLETAGQTSGFEVEAFPDFIWHGERVSSTRIRAALASGDLKLAADLLGRSYSITGRVMHGAQRGRTLGFPTANIALKRLKSPLAGVYAVRVQVVSCELSVVSNNNTFPTTHNPQLTTHCGVANLGTRPTVDGTRVFLEVHLFDFNEDIYGRELQVEFLHFLRPEKRFESLDALKAQIARDAEQARQLFKD